MNGPRCLPRVAPVGHYIGMKSLLFLVLIAGRLICTDGEDDASRCEIHSPVP